MKEQAVDVIIEIRLEAQGRYAVPEITTEEAQQMAMDAVDLDETQG